MDVLLIVVTSEERCREECVHFIIHDLNSFPRPGGEAQRPKKIRRSRSWERHSWPTQNDTPSGWKRDEKLRKKNWNAQTHLWSAKWKRKGVKRGQGHEEERRDDVIGKEEEVKTLSYEHHHDRSCRGKSTLAPQWTIPDRKSPMIAKEQCRRNNNKNKTKPRPYLRRYCHVLSARITGEPPAFRGKSLLCEKDTVKIVLHLKPPDELSSRLQTLQRVCRFELGKLTHHIRTLSFPPAKILPTLRFHLERPSGSPDHHRGLHKHRICGCGPLLLLLSWISYSKLVSWHFLLLFLGISILSLFPCHGGLQPPFIYLCVHVLCSCLYECQVL